MLAQNDATTVRVEKMTLVIATVFIGLGVALLGVQPEYGLFAGAVVLGWIQLTGP